MTSEDHYDLNRFVVAQEDSYGRALSEMRAGRKQSHWMWFVFPQIAGLGRSPMSVRYAIRDSDEARAFLAHPLLGPRLLACFEAVENVHHRSAHDIFGSPDDLKLRSCATLFATVSPEDSVFHRVLDHYFNGASDRKTLILLGED